MDEDQHLFVHLFFTNDIYYTQDDQFNKNY